MGTAKYDNLLYDHTITMLNNALPMEWTIRALQKSDSTQYQSLKKIDIKIRDFWYKKQFNDDEILDYELMSKAWDSLQIGKLCSRSFTKFYREDILNIITSGLSEIIEIYKNEVEKIQLPSIAEDYRYYDLLNGNDIFLVC